MATAQKDEWFGGERLRAREKSILVRINAVRVREFMDSVSRLVALRKIGVVEVDLSDEFELPESERDQSVVQERFKAMEHGKLLWGGFTVKGLGVAFLGSGKTQGERPVPELGVVADPKRKRTLLLPGSLWHGNVDDAWDSGWDQHSYQAADWNRGVSAFKPLDESGCSVNRGHYNTSLLHDTHFLYNGKLYNADILFSSIGAFNGMQATLGHRVVRTLGEKRGFPAYNFERQITPEDDVFAMSHVVLTSYSSM